MAAHRLPGPADRRVGEEPRLPVAEVHLAPGEAGDVTQQPGHRVGDAAGVLQRAAERHEAAAFAVHRPAFGETAQPFAEPGGGREPAGVQLGIAARQPADVAAEVRRLVGQRREGQELGARRAPGPCDVRIDEAEGGVLGNGDALAGRRQRGLLRPVSAGQRAGEPEDRVEIERPLDRIRGPVDPGFECRMLAGLHQPEVPLRQRHLRIAVERADHRQAERRQRLAHHPLVPLARDPVQDHAPDAHRRIVRREAARHRGRGLRLARDVEDQEHRRAVAPRQIGGGAAALRRRGDAVEEPHRALDDQDVGALRLLSR